MSEDHKARIRAFIDRVLTAGEIDTTGDYFHGDVVEEVPFPGRGPGLEGLKETLTWIRRAFPDLQWSVEEQMAEDNRVLTRFLWSGTHQGEFLGIPATSRVVRVWGMVIDRFEDEKVESTRILLDSLSLMQQLGVVPTTSEASANPNAALSSGHGADYRPRPLHSRFWPRLIPVMTPERIDEAAKRRFDTWGGVERLEACASQGMP